ncbi:hypothetical protein F0562_022907 [Nyssa sinensis]|uniref:Uncharacterized protein n=1 Tax=Nyssa sinensis TaxID=561372 RepID=A0A5J5BF03_9ASTE|nr:hypothetical protein F0562_022907 [Nyssa sinensis]
METNLPVVARRLWSMIRVVFFMLRKGIAKRKLMVDLNMMMKRGKTAGKAIHNLMFHHHHHNSSTSNRRSHDGHLSTAPGEYEFSCSNSPAFPFPVGNKRNHSSHFFSCAHAPPTEDDLVTVNAVKKMLEMLNSEAASPALPGFGRTPMVRQLRITDSPFPLQDVRADSHVDEAAEKFIMKFYNELRQQNVMGKEPINKVEKSITWTGQKGREGKYKAVQTMANGLEISERKQGALCACTIIAPKLQAWKATGSGSGGEGVKREALVKV